jgi:multiple sugar transport system substrate-binding protein
MRKRLSRFGLLVVLPLLSVLLAACARDDRIHLRIADWAGVEEMQIVNELLDEFMRRHPEVRVTQEAIPNSYRERILTSMTSGAPPDVLLLDSIDVPAFVDRGLLVDLAPYADRVGLDLDLFYPNILAIAQRGKRLYAFPKDFTPLVIYYNKNVLDRFNLSYPSGDWTWEDFLRMCKQVTVDEDGDGEPEVYGTFLSKFLYLWQPWVWANGGDILSPDGRRATGYLDSPETVEALQFLLDLRLKHRVVPTLEVQRNPRGRYKNMFYLGKIAFYQSGHWWLPETLRYLKSGRIRIGTAPLPRRAGKPRANIIYESGWAVPVMTPHRKWAVRLAAFMSSEVAQRTFSRYGLAVSAMRHVAEEMAEKDPWGVERAFLAEIPYVRSPWGTRTPEFRPIQDMLIEIFDRVIWQGEDVQTAASIVARKIDAVLRQFEERQEPSE